jgi:hypothetical protein
MYSLVWLLVVTVALHITDLFWQFPTGGHSLGLLQLHGFVAVGVLLIIDLLCASTILFILFMQQ